MSLTWSNKSWLNSSYSSCCRQAAVAENKFFLSTYLFFPVNWLIFSESMFLSNFGCRWWSIFSIIYWIFRWYLKRYYSIIWIQFYNLVSFFIAIIFFLSFWIFVSNSFFLTLFLYLYIRPSVIRLVVPNFCFGTKMFHDNLQFAPMAKSNSSNCWSYECNGTCGMSRTLACLFLLSVLVWTKVDSDPWVCGMRRYARNIFKWNKNNTKRTRMTTADYWCLSCFWFKRHSHWFYSMKYWRSWWHELFQVFFFFSSSLHVVPSSALTI